MTRRLETFLPVQASFMKDNVFPTEARAAHDIVSALGIKNHPSSPSDILETYGVFAYTSPMQTQLCESDPAYPPCLRSFAPRYPHPLEETRVGQYLVTKYGPVIGKLPQEYNVGEIDEIRTHAGRIVQRQVPLYQGRGFEERGVYSADDGKIKLEVVTKGNGTTGYWVEQRKKEMLTHTPNSSEPSYPMNPDPWHVRDHRASGSIGQKPIDRIVGVGIHWKEVAEAELAGTEIYRENGIYSARPLPLIALHELPTGTGTLEPVVKLSEEMGTPLQPVVLAKAWACNERVWGGIIPRTRGITAAHLISSKTTGGQFAYEALLQDLSEDFAGRKQRLQDIEDFTHTIVSRVNPADWEKILGPAGKTLQNDINSIRTLVPYLMQQNMMHNVVQAGVNRLYGKPVAWHLENVGLFGEVSGGERVYGKQTGKPTYQEIHTLSSYIYDAFMAVNLTNAAYGSRLILPAKFFNTLRTRIVNQSRGNHWLSEVPNLNAFNELCLNGMPEYIVPFRSEDAFPFIATDKTDASMRSLHCESFKDPAKVWERSMDFSRAMASAYK